MARLWTKSTLIAVPLALFVLVAQGVDYAQLFAGNTGEGSTTETDPLQEQEVAFEGDAWASWRVTVPAHEEITFRVSGQRQDSALTAFGIWTLDAETRHLDSLFVASTMSKQRDARHIQILNEDTTLVSHQSGQQGGQWGGWGQLQPLHDTLELDVVVLAGSDGHYQGTFTFTATENVTVHGKPKGGAAELATERDFVGPVNLLLEDQLAGERVHTKIIQDAVLPIPVEDHLFGAFKGDVLSGNLNMAFERGSGSRTTCPDEGFFPYTCFFNGQGPGEHNLRIVENIDSWPTEPLCSELHNPMDCLYPPIVWALVADVELGP